MPQRVVNPLKVIQIHDKHGAGVRRGHALQAPRDMLLRRGPVEEAGKRVFRRLFLQFRQPVLKILHPCRTRALIALHFAIPCHFGGFRLVRKDGGPLVPPILLFYYTTYFMRKKCIPVNSPEFCAFANCIAY